jgi:hypothetical protein
MSENDHEEQGFGIQTDAEAVVEMVELLAHRRSREEVRRHPRYPTAESLSGEYPPEAPFGWIVCGGETVHESGNGRCSSPQHPSVHRLPGSETLEVISGFHVVDFSQDGMQIQYKCGNPLKYSKRRLYLKVAGTTVPVSMQWFNGNDGMARAGVCFEESIDQSPRLAGILVELSDRLISYLVRYYLAENILKYREIAVFAFLCMLTNLRLRYVQALSTFNQTYATLDSFLGSNSVSPNTASRLKHLLLARLMHLHRPGKATDQEVRESLIASFMKPYEECGCSISGKEGRMVFLEKEVMEVVSSSLFFDDSGTSLHKGLISQLRPLHAYFNTLRELVPTLFGSDAFNSQFSHYSHAVSSVMDSREALIDLMSNLGSRLSAVACQQPADSRFPDGSCCVEGRMEGKEKEMPAAASAQ